MCLKQNNKLYNLTFKLVTNSKLDLKSHNIGYERKHSIDTYLVLTEYEINSHNPSQRIIYQTE